MDEQLEFEKIFIDEAYSNARNFRTGRGIAYIPLSSAEELPELVGSGHVYEDDGRAYVLATDVAALAGAGKLFEGFSFTRKQLIELCGGYRWAEQVLLNDPVRAPQDEIRRLSGAQLKEIGRRQGLDGLSSGPVADGIPEVWVAERPVSGEAAMVRFKGDSPALGPIESYIVMDAPFERKLDDLSRLAASFAETEFAIEGSASFEPYVGDIEEVAYLASKHYEGVSAQQLSAAWRIEASFAEQEPSMEQMPKIVRDSAEDDLAAALVELGRSEQAADGAETLAALSSGQCFYNPALGAYIDSWLVDDSIPGIYAMRVEPEVALRCALDGKPLSDVGLGGGFIELASVDASGRPISGGSDRFRADVAAFARGMAACGAGAWIPVDDLTDEGRLVSRRALAACVQGRVRHDPRFADKPLIAMTDAEKRAYMLELLETAAVDAGNWELIDLVASGMEPGEVPGWARRDEPFGEFMRGISFSGSYKKLSEELEDLIDQAAAGPVRVDGRILAADDVFALAIYVRGSLPESMVEAWMGGASIDQVCMRYDQGAARGEGARDLYARHGLAEGDMMKGNGKEAALGADEERAVPEWTAADAAHIAAQIDSVRADGDESPEAERRNAVLDELYEQAERMAMRAGATYQDVVALENDVDPVLGETTVEGRERAWARLRADAAGNFDVHPDALRAAIADADAAVRREHVWSAASADDAIPIEAVTGIEPSEERAARELSALLNAIDAAGARDGLSGPEVEFRRAPVLEVCQALGLAVDRDEDGRWTCSPAGPASLFEQGPNIARSAVAAASVSLTRRDRQLAERLGGRIGADGRIEAAPDMADEEDIAAIRAHEDARSALMAAAGALGTTLSRLGSGEWGVMPGGVTPSTAAAAAAWVEENLSEAAPLARYQQGWSAGRELALRYLRRASFGVAPGDVDERDVHAALAAAAGYAESARSREGDAEAYLGLIELARYLRHFPMRALPTPAEAAFDPKGVDVQAAFRLAKFDGVEEAVAASLAESSETPSGWMWHIEFLTSRDGGESWDLGAAIDAAGGASAAAAAEIGAGSLYGAERIDAAEFAQMREQAIERAAAAELERRREGVAEVIDILAKRGAPPAGGIAETIGEMLGLYGEPDEEPACSPRRLDKVVELLDVWQDELDALAKHHGFYLNTANQPDDGRHVTDILDGDELAAFTLNSTRIDAADAVLAAAKVETDIGPLGWSLRLGGREHGRGRGELPGQYGFSPERELAAWLVYDEEGRPSFIATARLEENYADFTQTRWVYQEAYRDANGAFDLDNPDTEVTGGAAGDVDMATATDPRELFAFVPEDAKLRAEPIDFRQALRIAEDSQLAQARITLNARLSRAELAARGFLGPAADYKHDQLATTLVLDRNLVSVSGDEERGYTIEAARIPAPGTDVENYVLEVSEKTLSPRGLEGEALLDWQAAFPDAYTVALRYAAGDSGQVRLFTGDELARQAIEIAPARVGAMSFVKGPATVLESLGAAPMSYEQGCAVLESVAHAQVASPPTGLRRAMEGVWAGRSVDALLFEVRSRFDATFEGEESYGGLANEAIVENVETLGNAAGEEYKGEVRKDSERACPPVREQLEVTLTDGERIASVMSSTCGDSEEDDVYYVFVADVEADGSLTNDYASQYVLEADDPSEVRDAWHEQFPNARTVALLALKDPGVFEDRPQTVFGDDLEAGVETISNTSGDFCFLDLESGCSLAEQLAGELDVELVDMTAEEFFAQAAAAARAAKAKPYAAPALTAEKLVDIVQAGGGEPSLLADLEKPAGELMQDLERFAIGQLSGLGTGTCPLGSFEACAAIVEEKARRSCEEGKRVLSDLGSLTAQWKAACGTLEGTAEEPALARPEAR